MAYRSTDYGSNKWMGDEPPSHGARPLGHGEEPPPRHQPTHPQAVGVLAGDATAGNRNPYYGRERMRIEINRLRYRAACLETVLENLPARTNEDLEDALAELAGGFASDL